MEASIPNTFRSILAHAGAILFRIGHRIWQFMQPIQRTIFHGLAFVSALILRIFFPVYRVFLTLHLRFRRILMPSRGWFILLITNRYLLHSVLGIILACTIGFNITNRQALAQDVGRRSLLFALASDEYSTLVEEHADARAVSDSNYLGKNTISSLPHIDFDYAEDVDATLPATNLPATIAVQPYEEPVITDTTTVKPRTTIETYIVQEGDTVGTIAQRFGINIGSILWNNQLTARQYIRPGDSLHIPPVSGLIVTIKKGDTLSKLASRYQADVNDIQAMNSAASFAPGTELVIPGGTPPATSASIASNISERNPSASERTPIRVAEIFTPKNVQKPKDLDTKELPKTRLLWPTSGHVITQYYGWRHTGIDIDGDFTSPLYAATDGVVEKAGWNGGGYGLQIVVDHGNGMRTRYAHASKLFVKVGDTVKRGQVIAMMGTTGRSTGTHIHFELYINNKRTNPLSYIR